MAEGPTNWPTGTPVTNNCYNGNVIESKINGDAESTRKSWKIKDEDEEEEEEEKEEENTDY